MDLWFIVIFGVLAAVGFALVPYKIKWPFRRKPVKPMLGPDYSLDSTGAPTIPGPDVETQQVNPGVKPRQP